MRLKNKFSQSIHFNTKNFLELHQILTFFGTISGHTKNLWEYQPDFPVLWTGLSFSRYIYMVSKRSSELKNLYNNYLITLGVQRVTKSYPISWLQMLFLCCMYFSFHYIVLRHVKSYTNSRASFVLLRNFSVKYNLLIPDRKHKRVNYSLKFNGLNLWIH